METLAPTWNLGLTATTKWYARVFPSMDDVAFLLPFVALFAKLSGTKLLFSDGDTGWHIRTGEWILAHHAVPTTDLFSFTKSNQPWFAWEWAWDIIAAAVHSFAGLGGVAFVNTLLLGVFTLLLYRLALRTSGNHLMSMVALAFAAGASSIHWLARPHLCTWIFTLLFLHAIQAAQNDASGAPSRLLYVLPALMIPWVNLHGGFVAGLLILGCYALGEGLSVLLSGDADADMKGLLSSAWLQSRPYWIIFLLCTAATLVNPYGWNLHRHIYAYLSDAELLDKIQEFQSISFHAGPAILFEIGLLLAAFVVFGKLRQRQFTPVLLLCFWAHYALLSARHIPLFMIVAAPYIAQLLSDGVMSGLRMPLLKSVAEAIKDISTDLSALEVGPRLHILSAAGVLLLAGLFALGQPPFKAEFNPDAFPVQAVPVLKNYVGDRIFTTDQWADYLIYRFYPAQQVFFDGRSDFYGNDFVKVNQRMLSASHDWMQLLRQYSIRLVLLKPDAPLSAVLKLQSGANVLFDDGKVIVFDLGGVCSPDRDTSLGQGKTAIRAAIPASMLQSTLSALAVSLNTQHSSQKGKQL